MCACLWLGVPVGFHALNVACHLLLLMILQQWVCDCGQGWWACHAQAWMRLPKAGPNNTAQCTPTLVDATWPQCPFSGYIFLGSLAPTTSIAKPPAFEHRGAADKAALRSAWQAVGTSPEGWQGVVHGATTLAGQPPHQATNILLRKVCGVALFTSVTCQYYAVLAV